jgi:hypothetical protein
MQAVVVLPTVSMAIVAITNWHGIDPKTLFVRVIGPA